MAPIRIPKECAPVVKRIFEAHARENASLGTVAQLDELDRRVDRLVDAFASRSDLNAVCLHRALSRLELERQGLLNARKREQDRPLLPDKLDVAALSFEDKKMAAAQFIRRIDLYEDCADIIWNV